MECVIGMVGHKTDEDKIMLLDSHKLMGASGEPDDRVQFTEFIQKNLHLYQFRNSMPLSTAATATALRKWISRLRQPDVRRSRYEAPTHDPSSRAAGSSSLQAGLEVNPNQSIKV